MSYPFSVAHLIQATPLESEKLPRSARELAVFLAVLGIVINFAFFASSLTITEEGGLGLSDLWKVVNMAALVIMMTVLAFKIRSTGLEVTAVLLTIFFIEESGLLGDPLGTAVAEASGLEGLQTLVPTTASNWGTFLVLGVLTIAIGFGLSLAGDAQRALLKRGARVLFVLMLSLFFFSGGWALFGKAFPQLALADIAGFGTMIILSLMVAYTGGLLRVVIQWSQP